MIIQSEPYQQFDTNLERLLPLIKLMMPTGLDRSLSLAQRRLNYQRPKGTKVGFSKLIGNLVEEVNHYVEARQTLQNSMSVMLVTFTDEYLEQALLLLASNNTTLASKIEPVSPQIVFAAESLDSLKSDLLRQWASQFLVGGPRKWLPALRKLGANGYKKDCDFRLQHLWDTRNLIVHTNGILRRDYVERYPSPPLKLGEPVEVSLKLVRWWIEGMEDFVRVTDVLIMKRRPRPSTD